MSPTPGPGKNEAITAKAKATAEAKGAHDAAQAGTSKAGSMGSKAHSTIDAARNVASSGSAKQGVQQGAAEVLKRTKSSAGKSLGTVLDTNSSLKDKAIDGAAVAAGAAAAAAVTATGVGTAGSKIAAEATTKLTSKGLKDKKFLLKMVVAAVVVLFLPTILTVGGALTAVTVIAASTAYNEDSARNTPDGGVCNSSSVGNLVGNGVEEKVWNAMIGAGWTPEQTAGIMGNIYVESGFNPFIAENTEGTPRTSRGWGLVQWTADRHVAIKNAVLNDRSMGAKYYIAAPSITSFPPSLSQAEIDKMTLFQINYILNELNTNEKAAGNHLKKQTTVRDSALSFLWEYERANPRLDHRNIRIAKAEEYYAQFKNSTPPTADPTPSPAPLVPGNPEDPFTGIIDTTVPAPDTGTIEDSGTQYADGCGGGLIPGDVDGPVGAALTLADKHPYVFGGGGSNGPSGGSRGEDRGEIGYDCSGVTQFAYFQGADITLPRTARAQWAAYKHNRVNPAEIQPGDLIFWAYGRLGSTVSHVAIYVGNGQMVEASRGRNRVVLTPARTTDRGFVGVARVLDGSASSAPEKPEPGGTFE